MPTLEFISYTKERSLQDFDFAIFSPDLPYFSRIAFSNGGSAISMDGTRRLQKAMNHWSTELRVALKAGKTIFFVAGKPETDQAVVSSSSPRKNENHYSTQTVKSYSVLPEDLKDRSSFGHKLRCRGVLLADFLESLSGVIEYRAVFGAKFEKNTEICTKDGATVGGVVSLKDYPGSIVVLPYFDFTGPDFVETGMAGEEEWTDKALELSHVLVAQLAAIDKSLRRSKDETPPPVWVESQRLPSIIADLESSMSEIQENIDRLSGDLAQKRAERDDVLVIRNLLFENGPILEDAINKALRLIGFEVGPFRSGDLEIDHVITSPEKERMIAETEGKNSSAIDIKKFRQLESNIGEDFERDEVEYPAKGILFGNGFRLIDPNEREDEFTAKCYTNARRLGSALVRTSDLYQVAVYVIDHPDDEEFKAKCRAALSQTSGGVVEFPNEP